MEGFDLDAVPTELTSELINYALNNSLLTSSSNEFNSTSILNVDQPDPVSFAFDDFENQLRSDFATNPRFTNLDAVLSSMMTEVKESYQYEQNENTNDSAYYNDLVSWTPGDETPHQADYDYCSLELEEENERLCKKAGRKRIKRDKKYLAEKLKGSSTINLSPEASKIMGIANDAFVKRNYDLAIENFLEVVRLSPKCHEPYHSLGLIYEELGQMQKAVCYYFLSAQLNNFDVDLWKRLAVLCKESGKYDVSFYMMGRALKQQPELAYSQERIQFAAECGNRKAKAQYMQFHALNFPSDLENIKNLCNVYTHEFQEPDKTFRFLLHLFDSYNNKMDQFTFTHLNFLTEMAYLLKNYKVLDQYIQKYGQQISVCISGLSKPSQLEAYSQFLQMLPAEIHAKFIIGKIHCEKQDYVLWMNEFFKKFSSSDHMSLYMQIAQALMEMNHYEDAASIYKEFLQSIGDSSSLLLTRLVDCYVGMKDFQNATECCKKILSLEANNEEIKFKLFCIYTESGQEEEASQILSTINSQQPSSIAKITALQQQPNGGEDESDTEFACTGVFGKIRTEFFTPAKCKETQSEYQKFLLLLSQETSTEKRNELISSIGAILISNLLTNGFLLRMRTSHLGKLSTRGTEFFDFAQLISTYDEMFDKDEISKSIVTNESLQGSLSSRENRIASALHGLTIEEWFQFTTKYALFLAITMKKYQEACGILHQCANINIFHHEPKKKYFLKFLQLGIALRQFRSSSTEMAVTPLETSNWFFKYFPENPKSICILWATGLATENCEHFASFLSSQKAQKRFKRFFTFEESVRNALLYSTNSLLNLTFNYTESTCQKMLQKNPDCKLIQFYLAVALLHRSLSRRCTNKQFYVLKSISMFFSMVDTDKTQENYFNLARAFHFLGCHALAEHYYQAALSRESMNLEYQIGYNLHLIYLKSNNCKLAREMLEKYCRIK